MGVNKNRAIYKSRAQRLMLHTKKTKSMRSRDTVRGGKHKAERVNGLKPGSSVGGQAHEVDYVRGRHSLEPATDMGFVIYGKQSCASKAHAHIRTGVSIPVESSCK